MFVGAGLIVILRGALNVSDQSDALPASAPRAMRLANDTIGLGIVWGLAMLFSWVAFEPGARHFSIGVAGLWMPTSGSGDTVGRVAFGFGAVLFWCITVAVTMAVLRKWRR